MDLQEFKNILQEELEKIHVNVNEESIRKLYQYMYIVKEGNEKINLTAIVEEKEMIIKHFVDSLTIKEEIKDTDMILDLGTGAGFPGIPLHIAGTGKRMVLVDSLNKRIAFLNNEVIQSLELQDIVAIHARAEELAREKEYREQFDVVTSRAVAPLNVLAEYLLPFTKVGGKCICMKGPRVEEEIENSKKAIRLLGGEIEKVKSLTIGQEDNLRNIVIIRKKEQTSSRFPRKAGMPTKAPIS